VNENPHDLSSPAAEGRPRRRPRFSTAQVGAPLAFPGDPYLAGNLPPHPGIEKTCDLPDLGLFVRVRPYSSGDHAGELVAAVFSRNPDHLNKAAVSVGLVGKGDELKRLTIPLDTPAEGGCSGQASFGPLSEVIAGLGREMDLVVFLLEGE
jgi:hypothetical protein